MQLTRSAKAVVGRLRVFVYRPRESGDIRTNPGRGHMRNQRSASLRKLTVVSLARMGKRPLQNETVLIKNNETVFSG